MKKIEEKIIRSREAFQTWTEQEQNAAVHLFGAFLGSCMVHNYGAIWEMREAQAGVKLKGDIFANPFQKVWKQYQPDGHYDSITSFYEISENIAEIINRKVKEQKKVWWKFW